MAELSTALGKPPLGAKAHRGAQERPSKPGFPKPFPPMIIPAPQSTPTGAFRGTLKAGRSWLRQLYCRSGNLKIINRVFPRLFLLHIYEV